MSRDVIDSETVKWDIATPGQAFAVTAENDDLGTAGQILTSQGPGLLPSYQDPPTGVNGGADFQRFNASGIWTKPAFDPSSRVLIRGWGGGGSGGRNTSGASGGAGGGPIERWMLLSELGSTETVTIGLGGAAVATNVNGNTGGNSTFGSHLTAYGGGGGSNGNGGGGGGGPLGAGAVSQTPGAPLIAASFATSSYMGQGGSSGINPNPGIWHGGGGGHLGIDGAGSIYGGGGGGGASTTVAGAGGASVNGGNGGAAGVNGASGVSGQQPGGGGGGVEAVGGAQSGGGGDGRFDVYVFPPQS